LKAQIFQDVERARRFFKIMALRQGDPSLR
jgi:hypothetical protein